MKTTLLKLGTVLAFTLVASAAQARDASIIIIKANEARDIGQFMVKLPTEANFKIIKPADNGRGTFTDLPQGSLICASDAINPWKTKYANYYLIVKGSGVTWIEYTGPITNRGYQFSGNNEAGLVPYAYGHEIPEGNDKYVIEKEVCAGGNAEEQAAAAVNVGGNGAFFKNLAIKHKGINCKSNDTSCTAHYIWANDNDKDYLGNPYNSHLPIGTVVCVSATLFPGLRYANYYFKVTKLGHTQVNLTGTVDSLGDTDKSYNFEGGTDGAGLGKPLFVRQDKACPSS